MKVKKDTDSSYWLAVATTQFTGDSKKYLSTHYAEFPKPKRDRAWELNSV